MPRLLSKSVHDPGSKTGHFGDDHKSAGFMSMRGVESWEDKTVGHILLILMPIIVATS